jgi:acid phosphatase family membrane protein YuiD
MTYHFLLIPFIALLITQSIKLLLFAREGKFSWKDFDSYGGMPSSHAAFMSAALTESYQAYGFESPTFALVAFLTFIVLRDAVGLRMTIGKHAHMINMLVQDLPDTQETKYPHLEPRQGHTYAQVFVGFLVGILIASLF